MRLLLAVAIGAAMILPVAAQDDVGAAAKGAACSMIADSLQRLTCFDQAFPKGDAQGSPTPPAAPSDDTGAWQVTNEKSPIDDTPKVIGVLSPSDGRGIFDRRSLLIRCIENVTSVVLGTDSFNVGVDTAPVTLRVDGGTATTTRWEMSDSGNAVGLWSGAKAISFIKSLKTAKQLAVRVQMSQQVDMVFDLTGVGAVADQVAAACKWPN